MSPLSRREFAKIAAAGGVTTAALATTGITPALGQVPAANRIVLGRLANGATVTLVPAGAGEWGSEVAGSAVHRLTQPKPAQIEVFRGGQNVSDLAAGYQSVRQEGGLVAAKARVEATEPGLKWRMTIIGRPGCSTAHRTRAAPGGTAYYDAGCFSIREDYLSAPMFGLSFRNEGHWAAAMNMAPRGDTTASETTANPSTPRALAGDQEGLGLGVITSTSITTVAELRHGRLSRGRGARQWQSIDVSF